LLCIRCRRAEGSKLIGVRRDGGNAADADEELEPPSFLRN
jgi:hypothetical protein